MVMSQEQGKQGGRRSFLRKAAAGALGGAVVTFGLENSAEAATRQGTPGTIGTNNKIGGKLGTHGPRDATQKLYHVDCCELLYHFCTISQLNNCPNHWAWTCCAYVGSSLTLVNCYECYSHSCSDAQYIASC